MGSLEDFWLAILLVDFLLMAPLVIVIISAHVKRRKMVSKNVLEGDRAFIYLIITTTFIVIIRLYEVLSKNSGFLIVVSRIIVSFFLLFYFIKVVSKVGMYTDKKVFALIIIVGSFYLTFTVISRIIAYNILFEITISFIGLAVLIPSNFFIVKYLINTKGVSV